MSYPRLPHTLDDMATEHLMAHADSHVMYDPRIHAPASLTMVSKYDDYNWQDSIESEKYISAIGAKRPTIGYLLGSKQLSFQE